MTDRFSIRFDLDLDRRIWYAVATGPMDSARYIDSQIENLSSIEAPWTYNRLQDLTACTGSCAYAELERLADFWRTVRFQMDRDVRVAIVTSNAMTVAKLPVIELMYARHELRAFAELVGAQAWLSTPTSKAAA